MRKILAYLCVFIIGFGCGFIYDYEKPTPIETPTENVAIETNAVTSTTVEYVPKESDKDADIELKSKSHLLVSANFTEWEVPTSNVKEENYFDNGKLVINREESYKIDLTDVTNELARYKYDRTGKVDFGLMYADDDLYGGVRYNAKAWDLTYYHSVAGNEQGIAWFYKF